MTIYLRFWLKNIPYLLNPQGKKFLSQKDPNYVHERDKHEVRHKHYGRSGWKDGKEGDFRYRDYNSYEEYITHQKQKYEEILKIKGGFSNRVILSYRLRFYHRFRHLQKFLPRSAKILCAGARQGTEVEVLHDLGYRNSFGIDLNLGQGNRWVGVGDFMNLKYGDSSIDMIYSNSIDHAYDLDTCFAEHARVIKPNGYALYDIAIQSNGVFESVKWEFPESLFHLMLRYFQEVVRLESEDGWKWILLKGKRCLAASTTQQTEQLQSDLLG